jgi:uncharacterized membrane protein YfcA
MDNQILEWILIAASAFAAGMINSVAGGGTLVSFPALVWLGRDAVVANATNAVALWPGSLAGMIGFRREIEGSRKWMLILGVPSLVGGLVGAILLLLTPSRIFALLVPYLIFFATLLFAFGDFISKKLRAIFGSSQPDSIEIAGRAWWIGASIFQFFVAVYGGYFGAGIGILMLAALGLLGLTDIHQMNGMKNFFAFVINGIASVYFIWSGKVAWGDALIMALAATAGGFGGAGIARRMGRQFVRRVVIIIGFAMAISLLFR